MTLIIGARFKDAIEIGDNISGVVLISDRLVTSSDGTTSYNDKIIMPEGLPIAVCASGYVNLFNEFNRKVIEKVRERIEETRLKNIKALRDAGYDIDKIMEEERKTIEEKKASDKPVNIKEEPNTKIEPPKYPIPPYIYSVENFLDDCRILIEQISSKYANYNPLEVVMALQRFKTVPYVSLHKIDCNGNEEEIKDFTCAGSGTPYVDMFFDSYTKKGLTDEGKHIKTSRTLIEIIQLATLAIKFVEKKIKGSGVGIEENRLPQIVTFLDFGKRGLYTTLQQKEILNLVNKKLDEFDLWSDNSNNEFFKITDNRYNEVPIFLV
jgi:20S proteasome alpha/beta subunit